MQSIGERLEEARKKQGISLREAGEATKIRSDFLSNFEQNRFDFDLPEIYKRGFIRNYAVFLKIDADNILNDYNAQLLSQSRTTRRAAGSEWFGRIDPPAAKGKPAAVREAPAAKATDLPTQEPAPSAAAMQMDYSSPRAPDDAEPMASAGDGDKTAYLKIGLVLVGTAVLAFILLALVGAILGGGDKTGTVEPELQSQAEAADTAVSTPPWGSGSAVTSTLMLRASGPTYVNVRKSADRSEIYKGTLAAGDVVPLEKIGPVDIVWTKGENLAITLDGEDIQTQSGTAKISIP